MILKYQKIIDDFTTHTLVEPDYKESDPRITELYTIGDVTFVHIPDGLVLPEQPFNLEVTMEEVTLTDELRAEIKALSPHVALINTRVVEKIRAKYSQDDEMKMHREYVEAGETEQTAAYIKHVADCRAWGRIEKAKIGL